MRIAQVLGVKRGFANCLNTDEKDRFHIRHYIAIRAGIIPRHPAPILLKENQSWSGRGVGLWTLAVPLLRLAIEKQSHVEFARRLLTILETETECKPVTVLDTGKKLTPREAEILKLIAAGASNQVIAGQLVISESTVKVHVTSILAKLRASSRTQAALRAQGLRLV